MSRWILMLFCLFLSDMAQALMKVGVDRLGGLQLRLGTLGRELVSIVTSWHIMLGIVCYGVGLLLWLKVLGDYRDYIQSMVYSTIHYLFILLIAVYYFREQFTLLRGLGFAIIVVGILVFACGEPAPHCTSLHSS